MAKAKSKATASRSDEELLVALGSSDYAIYAEAEEELEDWFEAHPGEALARATRVGKLALTRKLAAGRQKAGYTVLPVIAGALRPREVLPAEWDPLVSAFGEEEKLRAVLGKIPVERRTAIFDREIRGDDPNAISRTAEFYLDLAPESTKTILDHYAARGELRQMVSWSQLTQWRRKVPRIGSILNEYAALAKKAPLPHPPPPKVAGSLSFADPIAVYPSDYNALDAVAKAQYRTAAEAYVGVKIRDDAHFVRILEKQEMNEGDAAMRRWNVIKAGKHVYDFWVVWVDNGSLFHAGTPTRIAVHQIQDDFQALDNKSSSKVLAEDLNNSYPGDLWTMPKKSAKKKKHAR